MRPSPTPLRLLAAAALLAAAHAPLLLFAQDDPFGDPAPADPKTAAPPPAARPAAPPAAAAAKTPAAKGAKSAKAAPPAAPLQSYPLAVQAILAGEPKTPRALIRAIDVLTQLGEPDLARPFLQQLIDARLNPDALADLVVETGSAPWLRLSRTAQLQPEGAPLADAALQAATARATNPARLKALVAQLAAPSPGARRAAAAELLNARSAAVPPLLETLADPQQSASHAAALSTLVALSDDALGPLLAAVDSAPQPAIQRAAIQALAELGRPAAVPHLVGPSLSPARDPAVRAAAANALGRLSAAPPTRQEAIAYLAPATRDMLAARVPLPKNASGEVDVWFPGEHSPRSLPLRRAAPLRAARLAADLYEIAPQVPEHRRLFLVAQLESADDALAPPPPPRAEASAGTTAQPAPSPTDLPLEQLHSLAALGVDPLEDALRFALANGHPRAAAYAARLLGDQGSFELLTRGGASPSPLVEALRHPDPRVRFAAAEAIVRFQPKASFPGLGRFQDTLLHFARGFAPPAALVAFPNSAIAQQLAGDLNTLGFEAVTATNGRDLVLQATDLPQIHLILLGSRIDRAPLSFTLQQLRAAPATANLPIIILAEDDELPSLKILPGSDRLTSVILRPRSLDSLKFAVDNALRRAADLVLPAPLRQAQATAALRWLGELHARDPRLFDLRTHAEALAPGLFDPAAAPPTATLLGQLGAPPAQRALLEAANRSSLPLPTRQAAAAAFGDSVRRHRLLLTQRELLAQYDRYNASSQEDPASQQLLSTLLDAIELPTRAEQTR